MVQLSDPNSTVQIDTGIWFITGAATAHECLDEGISSTDNATTRISTVFPASGGSGAAGDNFEVGLESVNHPGTDRTGHILRVRGISRDVDSPVSNQGTMRIRLYQGSTSGADGTLIFSTVPGIPGAGEVGHIAWTNAAYTTYTLNIPEADAANITDYSDLSVEGQVVTVGTEEFLSITTIEFEVPDQGKISAEADIAITASGSVRGVATEPISASANIPITAAGALTGKASLSATASIAVTASASMVGSGSLSGTMLQRLFAFPQPVLIGAGAMSSTASIALTTSAAGVSKALASATASIAVTASGSLVNATASGAMSASATMALTASGSLVGVGSLSASADVSVSTQSAIAATAAMSATASIVLSTSGVLNTPPSAISATASISVSAASVLTARASASSSVAMALTTAATLRGVAGAAGTVSLIVSTAGSLTGSGSLSAAVSGPIFTVSGTLIGAGIGQLAATAAIVVTASANAADADLGCAEAIHRHIRVRFHELVEIPGGMPVAYDGEPSEDFNASTPQWIRLKVDGEFTDQVQFGANNMFQKHGAMVAEIHSPIDRGNSGVMDTVDLITTGFRRQTYGPVRFRDAMTPTPGRRGSWWVTVVRVDFDAYEEVARVG